MLVAAGAGGLPRGLTFAERPSIGTDHRLAGDAKGREAVKLAEGCLRELHWPRLVLLGLRARQIAASRRPGHRRPAEAVAGLAGASPSVIAITDADLRSVA